MPRMLAGLWLLSAGVALSAEGAPAFTRKPTATGVGDQVRITFAVDRATDVAVYIEDAQGKVVRHLVAGVLGSNPPAPLTPNALDQTIFWDGTADDGRPAGDGPFRVRVALALGAAFDKTVISNTRSLRGINAAAVGPDGTLYLQVGTGMAGWGGAQVLAFNRDGSYRHMVTPFPASLSMDRVKGFDVLELDGRPAPLVHDPQDLNFYPVGHGPRKLVMGVTPDGVLLKLAGGASRQGALRMVTLGTDGSAPWGDCGGPVLDEQVGLRSFIAVASDGKSAFVSGLKNPVVYRAKLPERAPLERFFGDPTRTAADETHLAGTPYGLALDGKGHLLIADNAGDRVVVVSERDGSFVESFAVDRPSAEDVAAAGEGKNPKGIKDHGPDCLAVHPKTGAIYLTRLLGGGHIELMKLSGARKPKVIDRVRVKNNGNGQFPWLMVADTKAEPAIIWLASDAGTLLRIEDLGDTLGEAREVTDARWRDTNFLDLSVDRVRNEVYLRGCSSRYYPNYWWHRYDEATDTLGRVEVKPLATNSGAQLVAGPDGYLYCPGYVDGLHKFDREGQPAAWAKPRRPADSQEVRGRTLAPHVTFMPVSECWMKHVLGIRRDGHLFILEPGHNGQRPPKMLREYLPSGELAREEPVIWKVSDGAVGPKFDRQGNIYLAEIIKPVDAVYPSEFKQRFGDVRLLADRPAGLSPQDNAANMYGSVVKFSPKGGMVHYPTSDNPAGGIGENPFKGEPKLDPSLKTVDAAYYTSRQLKPVKVTGALWIKPGYNHVEVRGCTCESTRFDVDDFGRVWFPDLGRFRVCVLDTNGNDITHFGRYGNANTTNAIAFAWLTGVGVSERYIYTSDGLNRRLLRCRMVYQAEATCEIIGTED